MADTPINLPMARNMTLGLVKLAADGLVICEVVFFRRSLAFARSCTKAHLRRARFAKAACVRSAEDLSEHMADLFDLGLADAGIKIVDDACSRIQEGREAIIRHDTAAGRPLYQIPTGAGAAAPYLEGAVS